MESNTEVTEINSGEGSPSPTRNVVAVIEIDSSSSPEHNETKKRVRFAGAARRRLSSMLKSGIPYETAVKTIIEQRRIAKQQELTSSAPASTSKNHKSQEDPADKLKRIKVEEKPNRQDKEIVVGIIDLEYPSHTFSDEQLALVQSAIMNAVESIPDDGPQVRFRGCSFQPGWLSLTCADQQSCSWVMELVVQLKPWDGAFLKAVKREDIPKPHVRVVFIPDDIKGTRQSPEKILLRLKKMNHGLETDKWEVLECFETDDGHTWTFSMDEVSFKFLERIGFKPYYSFGQIHFREKSPVKEVKRPPARFHSKVSSRKSETLSTSRMSHPYKEYRKKTESRRYSRQESGISSLDRKFSKRTPEREDRKSFRRTPDRENRKSFRRTPDREDRKSFRRTPDREDRNSFRRTSDREDRNSFRRTPDREDRNSFRRAPDREDRKYYRRTPDREDRKFSDSDEKPVYESPWIVNPWD